MERKPFSQYLFLDSLSPQTSPVKEPCYFSPQQTLLLTDKQLCVDQTCKRWLIMLRKISYHCPLVKIFVEKHKKFIHYMETTLTYLLPKIVKHCLHVWSGPCYDSERLTNIYSIFPSHLHRTNSSRLGWPRPAEPGLVRLSGYSHGIQIHAHSHVVSWADRFVRSIFDVISGSVFRSIQTFFKI